MATEKRRLPWLDPYDQFILVTAGAALVALLGFHYAFRAGLGRPGPEVTSAPRVESHRVDINTAKCWELRAIRGIGPKTAEAIVKCRTRRGDFENVDALVRVDGIAEKTVERLRPYLTASTRGTPDGKED